MVKGMVQLFLPTRRLKIAPRSWGSHPYPPLPYQKKDFWDFGAKIQIFGSNFESTNMAPKFKHTTPEFT